MTFNADQFMNTTVDSAGSTEAPKTPEGEFTGVIGEITSESIREVKWTDEKGVEQTRLVFEVPMIIRDQEINAKTQRDTIVHREGFFLDFTPDGTKLDMSEGKNTKLNQLRDVLGQNVAGWSPMHFSNAGPFKFVVKHTPGKGRHDGKVFVNVTKYAKIS